MLITYRIIYSIVNMLLTVRTKLLTTPEQHDVLLQTMEVFNETCNFISEYAYTNRVFGKYDIHKHLYYEIRRRTWLSSEMVVRAIGKVAETYRTDRHTTHVFDLHGPAVYDQRVLSYKAADQISIWALGGRIRVPIRYGEYRKLDLKRVRGQADLFYVKGTFYLMIVVDIPEDDALDCDNGFLGVDLGIVNIATTSDGKTFSGDKCTSVRKHYAELRSGLQSVGTRSAKNRLRKISGRESRFKTDTNHCISKTIVETAKGTDRAIAIEDLTGIRNRGTVSKAVRESIGKWAFYQLRKFIEYKAKLSGLLVVAIDPRDTSRRCSECGHIDKANRKSQSSFVCLECGHTEHADINAAKNISLRAAVNQPIVFCPLGS